MPCETQDPPNLNSEIGPAPATSASGEERDGRPPTSRRWSTATPTLLTEFDKVKKLRAEGSLPAAKQLLSTVLPQYDAWSKDWAAFQKANGIQTSVPAAPTKEAGR